MMLIPSASVKRDSSNISWALPAKFSLPLSDRRSDFVPANGGDFVLPTGQDFVRATPGFRFPISQTLLY